MREIRDWLEQLGLAQYAESFADNAIDADVLPELSDWDLQELGVAALGHRKRLLKAINALRSGDTTAPASARQSPETSAETGAVLPTATDGERRQLTVLFCDMVGFTELAGRVDPEVLQRIIRNYEDACAVCVTRYEGYVYQRLGDGIVAFFGFPLAHENEAERAIHAGLQIIDTVARLDVPDADRLAVRIGIATGLVVVSTVEKGAVGETMNLAARLQGIAPPGGVVVSDHVQRLAGGSFTYEDMGQQTLKGIAGARRAYRVVSVRVSST